MVLDALVGRWPGAPQASGRKRSFAERSVLRDRLQEQYQKQVRGLADSLVADKLTPAQWQDRMIRAVSTQMIRQTMIGRGGGIPQAAEIPGLDKRIQTQQAFLQRFAEQVSIAAIEGKLPKLSPAALAVRAGMYGGAALGEFWSAAMATATSVRYIAKDDGSTCGPCLNAEGVYSVNAPYPVPGTICFGRSRCRCKLEPV